MVQDFTTLITIYYLSSKIVFASSKRILFIADTLRQLYRQSNTQKDIICLRHILWLMVKILSRLQQMLWYLKWSCDLFREKKCLFFSIFPISYMNFFDRNDVRLFFNIFTNVEVSRISRERFTKSKHFNVGVVANILIK